MGKRFSGRLLIAVEGKVVTYIKSFRERVQTGRSEVQGMTPSGDPAGYADGANRYSLDVEAYIPVDGSEPNWEGITNGTMYAVDDKGGSPKTLFTDVFFKEMDSTWNEDGNAATRRITFGALKRVQLS